MTKEVKIEIKGIGKRAKESFLNDVGDLLCQYGLSPYLEVVECPEDAVIDCIDFLRKMQAVPMATRFMIEDWDNINLGLKIEENHTTNEHVLVFKWKVVDKKGNVKEEDVSIPASNYSENKHDTVPAEFLSPLALGVAFGVELTPFIQYCILNRRIEIDFLKDSGSDKQGVIRLLVEEWTDLMTDPTDKIWQELFEPEYTSV
jgi:hypothetical protein